LIRLNQLNIAQPGLSKYDGISEVRCADSNSRWSRSQLPQNTPLAPDVGGLHPRIVAFGVDKYGGSFLWDNALNKQATDPIASDITDTGTLLGRRCF